MTRSLICRSDFRWTSISFCTLVTLEWNEHRLRLRRERASHLTYWRDYRVSPGLYPLLGFWRSIRSPYISNKDSLRYLPNSACRVPRRAKECLPIDRMLKARLTILSWCLSFTFLHGLQLSKYPSTEWSSTTSVNWFELVSTFIFTASGSSLEVLFVFPLDRLCCRRDALLFFLSEYSCSLITKWRLPPLINMPATSGDDRSSFSGWNETHWCRRWQRMAAVIEVVWRIPSRFRSDCTSRSVRIDSALLLRSS